MDQMNLGTRLTQTIERYGHRPATRERVDDRWRVRSYTRFGSEVDALAARLIGAGLKPGDRVSILSWNRPEWTIADFAILATRAIVVPIYPTSTAEQVGPLLNDSGATWIFVSGASEVERLAPHWDDVPALTTVVSFDPITSDDPRVLSFNDLIAGTPEASDVEELARRRQDATGDDIASIIYTSGTTGDPRGVILTHRAFCAELDDLAAMFPITPEDHSLSFLPLSHAYERAMTFFVMTNGCMNTYTDARKVAEMLPLARPTMMVSVPRLYEKVVVAARKKVEGSPVKRRVFGWALEVGGKCQGAYRAGKKPSLALRAQLPLADKLVFSSVRDAMGGPKTVLSAGGAPMRSAVEEFFAACGMPIYSGYGLTEAAPLVTFNAPTGSRFGTAGRVMRSGELKIGPEDEILYRGPNVMKGYWNAPEKTAETLDADGWLHTGDVGHIDEDGFLHITDRLKDLIVTSNGKNIAPGPIEGMLMADPLIEQAVILGDNRPFVTLLVTPSFPDLEELVAKLHIPFTDRTELLTNPAILEEMKNRVQEMSSKLAHHEQIKDFRIMLEEFTQDNGLLTPTMKVRRREVEKRFGTMIDDMYAKLAEMRRTQQTKGGTDH